MSCLIHPQHCDACVDDFGLPVGLTSSFARSRVDRATCPVLRSAKYNSARLNLFQRPLERTSLLPRFILPSRVSGLRWFL